MDDTPITADEGLGTPILVIHGGMGDGDAWAPVTDRLRGRFRTVRLLRRQYRMDLDGPPVTMAQEVERVEAVARTLDRPILVGHASGGVVALEALVAHPELCAGAVLYEPPVVTGEPLGGPKLAPARAALAAGNQGRALAIFLRDVVEIGRAMSWMAGLGIGRMPGLRARVVRQLDDNDAIDALGVRLDAYRGVELPVLLIGGDRSPAHLARRLDALERALPHTRRLLMHGQGHGAQSSAPDRVAAAVARFVDEQVSPRLRS